MKQKFYQMTIFINIVFFSQFRFVKVMEDFPEKISTYLLKSLYFYLNWCLPLIEKVYL